MSGSEGKTLTTTYSPDPNARLDPDAEARAKNAVAGLPGSRLRVIDKRTVWQGKTCDLAQKIKNEYDRTHAEKNLTRAFDRAAEQYVRPDGREYTGQQLRNSWKQQDNKMKGKVR